MNIQLLNRRLAEEFGRTDQGEPKYRWARTTDLHYLYRTGRMVEGRTPAGLITMRTEWQRHPYSRIYGDRWLLAAWAAPEIDESEWFRQTGGAFPWPSKGEFHPIDSTILPAGREPDERLTQFVIQRLYLHLGLTVPQRVMLAEDEIQRARDADESMWSAALDDALPAFGSVPKDMLTEHTRFNLERCKHVSFPPVQKQQELTTV